MDSSPDLSTLCRKTTGDVPGKLVGASTTVVGSSVYLFGGRLAIERRVVAEIYVLDLQTLVWQKLPQEHAPEPRYFHSADAWNNKIVVFGGMGSKGKDPEDLCVLNDIHFFDLNTHRWLPSPSPGSLAPTEAHDLRVPSPRYAHLSSISSNQLFVIGGQDIANAWQDNIHTYDLVQHAWTQQREYPRHCGTYRSVAVSAEVCVRLPQAERNGTSLLLGPATTRFQSNVLSSATPSDPPAPSTVHLSYSTTPSTEFPSDVYLYSNYNFADVKRELEVLSLAGESPEFGIYDQTGAMVGPAFPPGLRFPTGGILGSHLIFTGTYISQTQKSFALWALDLITMRWSEIPVGSALSVGSWLRGCLWPGANSFVAFGSRNGDLGEDYNRRVLSWEDVAIVDLEAFGIYQPPALLLDIRVQELGLSDFEDEVNSDFELVCDDGRRLSCSRKILEDGWPWFKEQLRRLQQTAQLSESVLPPSSTQESAPDSRVTADSFHLSEPYPITVALLQYFYATALITPLQHAPPVLSQLLVIACTYGLERLELLVQHAMHRALSSTTAQGVYEVAAQCGCRGLQIRALRTMQSGHKESSRASPVPPLSVPATAPVNEPPLLAPQAFARAAPGPPPINRNNRPAARPRTAPTSTYVAPPPDRSLSPLEGFRQHTPSLIVPSTATPVRPPRSHRTMSVVSQFTDQDILAVAELMSPSDNSNSSRYHYRGDDQAYGTVIDEEQEEWDDSPDPQRNSLHAPQSHSHLSYASNGSSNNSYGGSSGGTSNYAASEMSSDDGLSPLSTFPSYQFPRPTMRHRSDSDTPSLVSSASYSSIGSAARFHSMPNTPANPHETSGYMDSIQENYPREERRRQNGVPPPRPYPVQDPRLFVSDANVPTMRSLHVEQKPNPRTQSEPQSSSSNFSEDSSSSSKPVMTTTPFARFMGRGKPAPAKEDPAHLARSQSTISGSDIPVATLDPKAAKSEEKRRKKEEAKTRMERLAVELREKQDQRKALAEKRSISSDERKERGGAAWEEKGSMYGGYM